MEGILIALSALLAVLIAGIVVLIITLKKKYSEITDLACELDDQKIEESLVKSQLDEIKAMSESLSSLLTATKDESARIEMNRQSLENDCADLRAKLECALAEKERLAEELRAASEEKEKITGGINNMMNAISSFTDVAVRCKTLLIFAKDTTSLDYIRGEIDKAVDLLNSILK